MRIAVICPCGKEFEVLPSRAGRSKYCSKACKYENQTRPSGLRYEIKVENRAWIKPGQRLSPATEIKPGERRSPSTEFKPGIVPWNFKGDEVGYHALHAWVRRQRGAPKACEFCDSQSHVQWANKSHEYRRDVDDWLALCAKCHRSYDMDHQGAARKAGKR